MKVNAGDGWESLYGTFGFDSLVFRFRKILYHLTFVLLCFSFGSIVSLRCLYISAILLDIVTYLPATAVLQIFVIFLNFAILHLNVVLATKKQLHYPYYVKTFIISDITVHYLKEKMCHFVQKSSLFVVSSIHAEPEYFCLVNQFIPFSLKLFA